MHDTPAGRAALAWMLTGAALIGTNGLMVRLAGTPPTVSAFYRMLFAGVLLALFVHLRRDWRPLPQRMWWLALLPATAFAADLWLWHRSILLIGPGLATLLANAQVFFMALAGVLLFGERVGLRFVAGIALAFFGLWLMLGADWATLPADYRWGVWLGLATGLCYAVYNIGLRHVQRAGNVGASSAATSAPVAQVLAMVSLLCAGLLGLAGVAEGVSFAIPTWQALGWLLLLAALGHCLSWILISRAMQHLSVALVGLLLLVQPVCAFLLDILVLQRETLPREWLGLAFTLTGIFLASLKRRTRMPQQQV
ncbi:DMT family transporter [Luteimonas fraxinea]|uniref:DMT family transporter n=1 Tax=Luteimonas fraxinea TaxID=2901869 RepID=A0ABS8U8N0_9GAMM|nr:DMT family transporter [Luteimonas fraxinea]MCD9095910.1 DMT family transporter [Luteimonas fraxinea]MCD9124499.1 DMT family transporter [Luteimonas fraxinea]UHH10915.1 DMT family transporter [Luteimonas fraxinea]